MDTSVSRNALSRQIRTRALDLGFETAGIAPLGPSDHAALYRAWIERGMHGEMAYLAREDAVATRLDPGSRWPELRSAVVVGHHYGRPAEVPGGSSDSGGRLRDGGRGRGGDGESDGAFLASEDAGRAGGATSVGGATSPGHVDAPGGATFGDPSTGVIARYARGRDYHRVVKKKLMELLRWVEEETGRELPTARAYVDTGPVLERELGQRAGIGWFGRNTMLIDPRRGSYFFLGELLLPFELEYDEPFTADRCGTCRACIPACPTGALLGRDEDGAPVMDATRCISYLTIENQGPIPEELRPLMGNRVYGCDICQEACPWNRPKLVQLTTERDYRPDWREAEDRPDVPAGLPGTESPSLVALMRMTREEWDVWTRGSAMRRAGYAGFKRNVAVAMGNWLDSLDGSSEEAVAVLRDALADENPLVREHVAWALSGKLD